MSDKVSDEFHGLGGSYEIRDGKRVLVHRTEEDGSYEIREGKRVRIPRTDEQASAPADAKLPAATDNKKKGT